MLRLAALLLAPVACLSAMNSNGATDRPLLVGAAGHQRFPTKTQTLPLVPLWPPQEYQKSTAARVIFTDPSGIGKMCGVAKEAGQLILACQGEIKGMPVIVLPNPCLWPEPEFYAAVVCHELGHVNGWRHK